MDICYSNDSCDPGIRVGLEWRFYQTGKRSKDFKLWTESVPDIRYVMRFSGNLAEIGLMIVLTPLLFLFYWGLSALFLGIFSGRVAFGLSFAADSYQLSDSSVRSGHAGLTMHAYPLNDIDLAFLFNISRSTNYLDNQETAYRFDGTTSKVGTGYVPDIKSSGIIVKYERETLWQTVEESIEPSFNRLLESFPSYYDTITIGWKF